MVHRQHLLRFRKGRMSRILTTKKNIHGYSDAIRGIEGDCIDISYSGCCRQVWGRQIEEEEMKGVIKHIGCFSRSLSSDSQALSWPDFRDLKCGEGIQI